MTERPVVPRDLVPRELVLRELVPGTASGPALVLDEPLSLWGGLDPLTGRIVDRHHPMHGQSVRGTVLILPHGRGSSSASSVLAETIRLGTAPVGMVLEVADEILVVGALVSLELYAIVTPVLLDPDRALRPVQTGDVVSISNGVVTLEATSNVRGPSGR